MDKSWILKPRNTIEYLHGLDQFLDFAFGNAAVRDRIRCPCDKCDFTKWETRLVVHDHLLCKPFPQNYLIWILHGETHFTSHPRPSHSSSTLHSLSMPSTSHPTPSHSSSTLHSSLMPSTSHPTPAHSSSTLHPSLMPSTSHPTPSPSSSTLHSSSMPSTSHPTPSPSSSTLHPSSMPSASHPGPSPSSSTLHSSSMSSTSHSTPSHSSSTLHSSSMPCTSHPTPSHLLPPVQPTANVKPTRKGGRESMRHWTVNVIDAQGNTKKIRVKVKDVLSINQGERVVVEFDENASPVGEEQALLAGFCGSLATRCDLFPINYEKWSVMPKKHFNHVFVHIVKPRFCFNTVEENASRYVKGSLGKKWCTHKHKLWEEFYDPASTRAQLIDNVPTSIQSDQWATFVDYHLSQKYKDMCKRNIESRKKQVIPYCGGAKSYARKRHEMLIEDGTKPGRGKVYLETHKKKDGSYVDQAKDVCEKIEEMLNENMTDESIVSPDDAVGQVFGKEHPGRVRCMGLGVAPTNVFRNTRFRATDSSCGTCSLQCQKNYSVLLDTLKAYIVMKEGKVPEQFAEIFVASFTSGDANTEYQSSDHATTAEATCNHNADAEIGDANSFSSTS